MCSDNCIIRVMFIEASSNAFLIGECMRVSKNGFRVNRLIALENSKYFVTLTLVQIKVCGSNEYEIITHDKEKFRLKICS